MNGSTTNDPVVAAIDALTLQLSLPSGINPWYSGGINFTINSISQSEIESELIRRLSIVVESVSKRYNIGLELSKLMVIDNDSYSVIIKQSDHEYKINSKYQVGS